MLYFFVLRVKPGGNLEQLASLLEVTLVDALLGDLLVDRSEGPLRLFPTGLKTIRAGLISTM